MTPEEATLLERQRCIRLIRNMITRSEGNPSQLDMLKRLLGRVQSPKAKQSSGASGGLLKEQLALPLNNSTNPNEQP